LGITCGNVIPMSFTTTLTSKGQMTIPVAFRRRLGVIPGESMSVRMQGNKVIVEKNDWRRSLHRLQADNRAYLNKRGIKPLSDEDLDKAINEAAQEAASQSYLSSLDSNK
jgi:AbrB family looped-hinge helix DNA binding protein